MSTASSSSSSGGGVGGGNIPVGGRGNPCMLAASVRDSIVVFDLMEGLRLQKRYDAFPHPATQPHVKTTINTIQFNHNNKVIVSCGDDGNVSYILSDNGKKIGALPQQQEKIKSLCFSHGSRFLCTGGTDRVVKLWDLKSSRGGRRLIREFTGHTDTINCLTFSNDDQKIASGSASGDILIHDCMQNMLTSRLRLRDPHPLLSVQYSPFSRGMLASCAEDGSVHVWDTIGERLDFSFTAQHSAPCVAVRFSQKNKLLMGSAGLDGWVYFYDVKAKKVLLPINVGSPVTSLAFLDDGITLAAGTSNGKIMLYDLRDPFKPAEITVGDPVNFLAFNSISKNKVSDSLRHSTTVSQTSSSPASGVDTMERMSSSVLRPSQPQPPPPQLLIEQEQSRLDDGMGLFSPIKGRPSTAPLHRATHSTNAPTFTAVHTRNVSRIGEQLSHPVHEMPEESGKASVSASDGVYDLNHGHDHDHPSNVGLGLFSPLRPSRKKGPITHAPELTNMQQMPRQSVRDTTSLKHGSVSQQTSMDDIQRHQPEVDDIVQRLNFDGQQEQLQNSNFMLQEQQEKTSSALPPPLTETIHHRTNAWQSDSNEDEVYGSGEKDPEGDVIMRHSPQVPAPKFDQTVQQDARPEPQRQPQPLDQRPSCPAGTTALEPDGKFVMQFIKTTIDDSLNAHKESVHRDIQDLHVDLLRQFHEMREDMMELMGRHMHETVRPLVAEIARLRDENRKLRSRKMNENPYF